MSRRSTQVLKSALSVLHYSGADHVLARWTRGVGVIFTMHHVRPDAPSAFEPNRILSITPEFLEATIGQVMAAGFDFVSIDEAHARLAEGDFERRFAAFTFDDGYKDNREHAYPILKRYGVPFTIYVPTDFADGRGELWWLALERLIANVDSLSVKMDGALRRFVSRTPAEKNEAFHRIYWWLRSIDEDYARQVVAELTHFINLSPEELCSEQVMGWSELRTLAADPLVTIGAHTRRHYALARLPIATAKLEIEESVRRIERELGKPCEHLSFPYGDERSAGEREFLLARELGLKTAVTTRKGLLQRHHSGQLTALPRLSLNGDFQQPHYVKVMLSGAPFPFWNALQRVTPV